MVFRNIPAFLNLVLNTGGTKSRIEAPYVYVFRNNIHELQYLLYFQITWVRVAVVAIVERRFKNVAKYEERIESLFQCAIRKWPFLPLASEVYVVLQLVLRMMCNAVPDGVQDVAAHLSPFAF